MQVIIDTREKKCDHCNMPEEMKNTFMCQIDRLYNSLQILESEMIKSFGGEYEPKFRCRIDELLELERMLRD